jgi:hypothetical protein
MEDGVRLAPAPGLKPADFRYRVGVEKNGNHHVVVEPDAAVGAVKSEHHPARLPERRVPDLLVEDESAALRGVRLEQPLDVGELDRARVVLED